MPLYLYLCEKCKITIERIRSYADMDKELLCETCGEPLVRRPTSSSYEFKKRWIPSVDGWKRGDM